MLTWSRRSSRGPTPAVFGQLWDRGQVEGTGGFDTMPIALGDGTSVRPWFCPGRGPELSAQVARRIARRAGACASPRPS